MRNIWLFAGLEARLLAEPVQADYAEGALSLVGYRASPKVAAPGDTVTLRLYWRANERLEWRYYHSTHLMTHPEVTSLAQDDIRMGGWIGWQTDTWFPGVVMRDVVRLELPEDAPAPQSYWLTLRVFIWPGHEYKIENYNKTWGVPPNEADRPAFDEETLVVFSLPSLPEADPPTPPAGAVYRFADGFTLSGVDLPDSAEAGGTLPLDFWWQTGADVSGDFSQFVHLIQAGGEDYFGYDGPPFGGSFPTADWPAGMQAVDHWQVPLPDDLPPGEYEVHTGMYSPNTGERLAVTDAEGAAVQDFSILLGSLTVE